MFACLFAAILSRPLTTWAQADLTAQLDQAHALEMKGDYQSAERIYVQALERAPENLEILKRLGIVEQTELKFPESIAHFKRVLAQDAHYPGVNFFLGASYLGENDFNQAIESFKLELAIAKPHPRCRYYLGLAFQSAGRAEEAISEFNRAVAENPKDTDSLYQLARMYKNASIQVIDRLKSLDPDSFQLHLLMAELHADEERYPDAIKEYQAALAKRPDAAGIHYVIGVAYWVQHQGEPAQMEFLQALKENPADPLTNLYLGDIAAGEHQFEEALQYLRIAEKSQPAMLQVHLLMGKCYRGLNDLEKAKTEFLAAIEADSQATEPHYLLAQVYMDLKDPEQSAKQFAEFERLSKLNKDKSFENGPRN
jgi:tetratricopeptide (TPR) repeat protein